MRSGGRELTFEQAKAELQERFKERVAAARAAQELRVAADTAAQELQAHIEWCHACAKAELPFGSLLDLWFSSAPEALRQVYQVGLFKVFLTGAACPEGTELEQNLLAADAARRLA